jgi:hypothetical protein
MPAKHILNEDWSDYDQKKKKKEDARYFSCEEDWETEYLIRKIKKVHPEISTEKIAAAIKACCNSVPAPRPRERFVLCVTTRLGLEDNNSGGDNPPPPPPPGPHNPPSAPSNRKVG